MTDREKNETKSQKKQPQTNNFERHNWLMFQK